MKGIRSSNFSLTTVVPLLCTDDYIIPPTMNLTLTSTQNRSCINISIIDDRLLEGNETFSMSLQASDTANRDQVKLGMPNTTNVTIVDNDGIVIMLSERVKKHTQHGKYI